MLQVSINGLTYSVKPSISILEACKLAGINIKRFCYHETLSVSGNCRMCLVEIENNRKVQASCVTEVAPGMSIFTDTPYVKKLRENVLESLLINHPLDCPICDQGGECDLQEQTKESGKIYSKFYFNKRGVENKNIGSLIKMVMSRCIQCTRCVRYSTEICGEDSALGMLGRGSASEIGFYSTKIFNSEISGNVIDLCPVGALTAKPYAFKSRPWELISEESLDLLDGLGSNIYLNFKQTEIVRILPKYNSSINGSFISDKARFFFDSFSQNRLKKNFSKKKTLSELITTCQNFKKQIYLIIDETCSLDKMEFLKKLCFKDNRINLVRQNNLKLYNNFFLDTKKNLNDFLLDLNNTCLIISSNLRFENAIINAKLRIKYNQANINFIGLGLRFNSTVPINFISLNINNICKILEGKKQEISTIFVNKKLSIILSKYANIRFFNNIESLFKRINSQSNILTVELQCNSVGSEYMNIPSIQSHKLKNKLAFFISLEDSLQIRKNFLNQNKPFLSLWLNPFGSTVSLKTDILIPVESQYESNGVFINLEGRPQALKSYNNVSLLKNVLIKFFGKLEILEPRYLNHLMELITNKHLFKSSELLNCIAKNFYKLNLSVKKEPFKASIEDFYLFDLNSQNSKTLATCSQNLRSLATNFK